MLGSAPVAVTIWFTEGLEFPGSSATLFDQNGIEIQGTSSSPGDGPTVLVLSLPATLGRGTYSFV